MLSTCRPPPGMRSDRHTWPPSVVRYRSGPNAHPVVRVAKRMSVTPLSPEGAMRAGTVPTRLHRDPPPVVAATTVQVLALPGRHGAAPSTQPRCADVHVRELALNPLGTAAALAAGADRNPPATVPATTVPVATAAAARLLRRGWCLPNTVGLLVSGPSAPLPARSAARSTERLLVAVIRPHELPAHVALPPLPIFLHPDHPQGHPQ